ncbi:hypothetical protein NHP190020_03910 [Helicobacter suis]|uniref:CobQ/CobB/MinD/ParA nucleotide binding domain-containing protein n=1 Tax=Helicobacter suis TaxID=104628 RepID=A0ABM7KXX9_9HELI|nr:hypothetical protein NHP190020_03910 [Helicobacter suis]
MTICIANEKGGSGKSTLCLNLAVQLLKDNKAINEWVNFYNELKSHLEKEKRHAF